MTKKYDLIKELKEPSVIYSQNPDDPNDPEVLVKGVGRYRLSTLVRNVQSKLGDLGDRAARADDHDAWKQVQWMLTHDAMNEMVRTIISAKKELEGVSEEFQPDEELNLLGEGFRDLFRGRSDEEAELRAQLKRLNEFIKARENELQEAYKKIEELQALVKRHATPDEEYQNG